jgi:Putative Actinobacterial Holin-X, holin superfamily III
MSDQPRGGAHAASDALAASDDRSIGELFTAISGDLSTLMRQEVALAKQEVQESATRAALGAGLLGGSGVAAHMVLLFVSISAWWGIGHVTGNAWAALIVATVWAIIAAVLYVVGRAKMGSVEGLPRTAETARQIPPALAGNEEKA